MPKSKRSFSCLLMTLTFTFMGPSVSAQGENSANSQQPPPENAIAYSADYPPIDNPAFHEELLSAILRINIGPFGPSVVPGPTVFDVTKRFLMARLSPYCYLSAEGRRGCIFSLGNVLYVPAGYAKALERFEKTCGLRIFVAQRGEDVFWILVYAVPADQAAAETRSQIVRDKNHLIVLKLPQSTSFQRRARVAAHQTFDEFRN